MFDARLTDPPAEAPAPAQLGASPTRGAPSGASADPSTPTPSPAELSLRARSLAARIGVLQAELVDVVTDAVTHESDLGEPVAGWLCRECRLLPDEAHRLVTLARRFPKLPETRAAFAAGQLSEATASRIARVATPTNETDILAVAATATGAQLQTLLRSYQRVRPKRPTPDAADDPADGDTTSDADQPAADPTRDTPTTSDTPTAGDTHEPEPPVQRDNGVRSFTDDHGRWHLHADLPAEWGAQIDAALDAAQTEEPDRPPTPADLHAHPDGRRTSEQAYLTRAEALLRVAQGFLATHADTDGLLPERFLILVTADADKLATTRHPTGVGVDDGCALPGYGPLDPATLHELACEAWITAVLTRHGRPVTTTQPTRFASPAQRLALRARDRTCRFPGCGRTLRLKAHHIVHAAHGGPTHLDNLVLLCQTHHTLIHKPGWHLTRHPDDTLTVTRPDGTQVNPGTRPPPGHQPLHDPSPPTVEPRTPAPGERLTAFAHDVILHHWLEAG
nr:HNH endonuclease [Acidimicrobiales bacterium]